MLLPSIDKAKRSQLLEDLNYLNMGEIKAFCDKHAIAYAIWIKGKNGERRRTRDQDRKGVILKRIRHFWLTGNILGPTVFPQIVVDFHTTPRKIRATSRLFYGQYDKNSRRMVELLKRLTNGRFRNGAIARIVARDFWSRGKAPTFEQFAREWMKAAAAHKKPNPEWAFLSDLSETNDTFRWRQKRNAKARRVIAVLSRIKTSHVGRNTVARR